MTTIDEVEVMVRKLSLEDQDELFRRLEPGADLIELDPKDTEELHRRIDEHRAGLGEYLTLEQMMGELDEDDDETDMDPQDQTPRG